MNFNVLPVLAKKCYTLYRYMNSKTRNYYYDTFYSKKIGEAN